MIDWIAFDGRALVLLLLLIVLVVWTCLLSREVDRSRRTLDNMPIDADDDEGSAR
ncbi:MAG: hypothetical protein M3Q39_15940 [Actinomycetota bacterium]|nr:hypothetical protein [Actinomycetota bacterium]